MVKSTGISSSIFTPDDIVYRVYQNIYSMMEYRNVDMEAKAYSTKSELIGALIENDPLILRGVHRVKKVKTVIFLFREKDALVKAKLQKTILNNSKPTDKVIIVSPKQMKAAYDNSISEIESVRRNSNPNAPVIYYINYKILYTEIPKYSLVGGTARILSADEAAEFERINKILPDKCGVNYDYDPYMLWIGAEPGDRVIFESMSETAGLAMKYINIIGKPRHVKG